MLQSSRSEDALAAVPMLWNVRHAGQHLREWVESRDYSGYEPYDLLNSAYLVNGQVRSALSKWAIVQLGKRFGGVWLRKQLKVPVSKNPKALGLFLAGYVDALICGEDCMREAEYLKSELVRLRSPGEPYFCWGYDWEFVSLRGSVLKPYRPNVIATVFCAQALLNLAEVTGDKEARAMAESAACFVVTRLNRSVNLPDQCCFSYTPDDTARIYNSSALAAALLARLAHRTPNSEYISLARRAMKYLATQQQDSGSWFYGAGTLQKFCDNFHTGYILDSLLAYRHFSGDQSVSEAIERGYAYYANEFFDLRGAPKYFSNRLYPIDIHCCSQAILTFAAFTDYDSSAPARMQDVVRWTLSHMRTQEGCFVYQIHRWWTDDTPYMRWGQAWMFRALMYVQRLLAAREGSRLAHVS